MIGVIGCFAVHHVARLVRSPSLLAQDAHGMRIVHHHQGVVLVGQVANGLEVGDDAIHREDAVGGDELEPGPAGLLLLGLQIRHVVVVVAQPLSLAEPDAVDDA